MAFIDAALPPCISAGSEGTPSFQVDIARHPSGYEQRVARRGNALRRWNLGYSIRKLQDLYDVAQFFIAVEGPLNTFPYLDRLDDRSCAPTATPSQLDALIGIGDGATATFQLRKSYVAGSTTKYRTITLPISGSVKIAVNGVYKTETTHYTVDYSTGIVTFSGGNIPANGHDVTAGFKFRCKVRFEGNDLTQAYEGFRVGSMPSVPIIEVL
jgi:uncharacterized protein (TIGR02217 family)